VTPLVGGLFTVGLKEASRVIAVLTLVVELALAVYVTVAYSWSGGVGPHGTVDFAHRWVVAKPLGLAADVGVDGVSLLLVVLTPLVVLLAVLGARDERREPAFLGWLLLLTSATVGSFVSRDLLEFFLFFELTLIPSYFLIAQWGGVQRTGPPSSSSSTPWPVRAFSSSG
jgi:NADH-quinone oxidoreductase subunit M